MTPPVSTKSSIWIGAIIDDLWPQLAFRVQPHQVIPAPDHRDGNRERMPHILTYNFEIKRPQGPDRIPQHAAVIGHNSHDAVLDHEARQGG